MIVHVILAGEPAAVMHMTPASKYPSHSALFSPVSGRVWAQFYYDDPLASGWIVAYASAENEPPRNDLEIPGSLIWMYTSEVPDYFPASLLEREFIVHVNYARRYLWQPEKMQVSIAA